MNKIISKFSSSIKRGTGEAYLLLEKYPHIDFSKEIIKAALNNFSFDNQVEGSRAEYIYGLFIKSEQKTQIRNKIIRVFKKERKDDWVLKQLFEIISMFAKNGDIDAKKVLYKRYEKQYLNYQNPIYGDEAILSLDGLSGLKYIAELKGRLIQNNPNTWDDGSLIYYFQSLNPNLNVESELEKESITNEYIKTYLKEVKRNRNQHRTKQISKCDYNYIIDKIRSNTFFILTAYQVDELSNQDIINLATDFLNENNPKLIEKYLKLFSYVKFPLDYNYLLNFAKRRVSSKNRIVEFANGALKFFQSNEIREFSIRKLNTIRYPYEYLILLASNYQKGDHKLLNQIVNRCRNLNEIHGVAISIIEVYKWNKTKECKLPLENIYNKTNCGTHRKEIIEILIENNVISNRILNEIKYDSYLETRLLVN